MRAAHLARLIFVHQASTFSLKFEPLVPPINPATGIPPLVVDPFHIVNCRLILLNT